MQHSYVCVPDWGLEIKVPYRVINAKVFYIPLEAHVSLTVKEWLITDQEPDLIRATLRSDDGVRWNLEDIDYLSEVIDWFYKQDEPKVMKEIKGLLTENSQIISTQIECNPCEVKYMDGKVKSFGYTGQELILRIALD